jgi:predicted small secreted protein
MEIMEKLPAILIALGMCVLTGYNTMEGFGEDMESAGDAIEDKAAGEDVDDDPE